MAAVTGPRALALAFHVLAFCSIAAHAQSTTFLGGVHVARMEQERKEMAAEAHQKKMVEDADRLVNLAQQLKLSVDKTNKDVLSVEVLRNAEKVEKLARELREGAKQ